MDLVVVTTGMLPHNYGQRTIYYHDAPEVG